MPACTSTLIRVECWPLGAYGVLDCSACVNNFILAAQEEGLAAVAQATLASYREVLRWHLGIPEGLLVVCGTSFGYEDERHLANGFRT